MTRGQAMWASSSCRCALQPKRVDSNPAAAWRCSQSVCRTMQCTEQVLAGFCEHHLFAMLVCYSCFPASPSNCPRHVNLGSSRGLLHSHRAARPATPARCLGPQIGCAFVHTAGVRGARARAHEAARMQKANAPGIVVVAESDCAVLLVHKICSSDAYNRQGGAHRARLRRHMLAALRAHRWQPKRCATCHDVQRAHWLPDALLSRASDMAARVTTHRAHAAATRQCHPTPRQPHRTYVCRQHDHHLDGPRRRRRRRALLPGGGRLR
jgi:hypothetical protein